MSSINKFEPFWLDQLQNRLKLLYWKSFWFSVIFMFSNVLNLAFVWTMSWFFLRSNTAVKSKSIFRFLHYRLFDSIQIEIWRKKIMKTRFLFIWVQHFIVLFNRTHWLSNLFNKIGIVKKISLMRISSNLYLVLNWLWVGFKIISF